MKSKKAVPLNETRGKCVINVQCSTTELYEEVYLSLHNNISRHWNLINQCYFHSDMARQKSQTS